MGRWGGGYRRFGGYGYAYGGGGGGGRRNSCFRCGRFGHYANECSVAAGKKAGAKKKAAEPFKIEDTIRGHSVTVANVVAKGGKHEGKVRALVKGPMTGPKGKTFYEKDMAAVRTVVEAFLARGGGAAAAPAAAAAATAAVGSGLGSAGVAAATAAAAVRAPVAGAAAAAIAPSIAKPAAAAVKSAPFTSSSTSSAQDAAAAAAARAKEAASVVALLSQGANSEEGDPFAIDDDEEMMETYTLLCTASLSIVGIQYYQGEAHPGEFVLLRREPENIHDRNAIRIDNVQGQKVGHIKKTQAFVLAPIMDRMAYFGVKKLDGSIPYRGDGWSLPLKLDVYGKEGLPMLDALRSQLSRAGFYIAYPTVRASPTVSAAGRIIPALPSVNVSSQVVVNEWKSQEELDSMFERQKAQLAKLKPYVTPPQLREASVLMEHQLVGASWLIEQENGRDDDDEIPFYRKITERGKTVWFSEITNSSQEEKPPTVKGGILADDMGLGKTLQTMCLILSNPPEGHVYPSGDAEEKPPALDATVEMMETEEAAASPEKAEVVPATTPGLPCTTPGTKLPAVPKVSPDHPTAVPVNVTVTEIRKVPVKNLRWVLSDCHILAGSADPKGTPPDELEKTKKPDLVKICQERLKNGSLSVERFRAGSAASNPPPIGSALTVVAPAPVPTPAKTAPTPAVTPGVPPASKAASSTGSADAALLKTGADSKEKGCITTLIVCPVSVMSNWDDQVRKHVKEGVLRVEAFQGSQRESILGRVKSNAVDILLVSYGILASEYKKLNNKKRKIDSDTSLAGKEPSIFDIDFHRVVLDEAHVVRNINTKAFKTVSALSCSRRICLTGTPLQNKPEDILSLFSFLGFDPLCDKDVFRRAIAQPIKDGDDAGLARLRLAMCHVALRRNKESADIRLGERELQIRSVSLDPESPHGRIYSLLFDSAQAIFQATFAGGEKEALKDYHSVLETLLRLRQACLTGLLVPKERLERAEKVMSELAQAASEGKVLDAEEARTLLNTLVGKFEANEAPECAICLCEISKDDATILKSCTHVFCQVCIRKAASMCTGSLCPLCRGSFGTSDMVKMSEASAAAKGDSTKGGEAISISDVHESELEQSPKICALLQAIREMENDEKGVIFSSFTKYLDVIEKVLSYHGHTYTRIDGSVNSNNRTTAIREFNMEDGGPRFILCSLKAAGTGINLTRGNHCFMMDPWWNKAAEDQAMDRVHRIGQKRKVRVLKFIIAASIEERMTEIQEAKAALGKGALERLDPEEAAKTRIGDLKKLFQITSESQLKSPP